MMLIRDIMKTKLHLFRFLKTFLYIYGSLNKDKTIYKYVCLYNSPAVTQGIIVVWKNNSQLGHKSKFMFKPTHANYAY